MKGLLIVDVQNDFIREAAWKLRMQRGQPVS